MRTPDIDRTPPERDRGFTIVESLFACLLTAALLGMVSRTVISVSSLSRENTGALHQESRRRDVLSLISAELQSTSLTSRGVTIDQNGHRIQFATLLGASQVGGEVAGVWSSPITISIEQGRVLHRQDGITVEFARGIRDLVFRHPAGEAFIEITCVTRYRGEDTTRSIRVYPKN